MAIKNNELIEANDFTKKIINGKLEKDIELYKFTRRYFPEHSEHNYLMVLKTNGTFFYSRTNSSPIKKTMTLEQIIKVVRKDTREFFRVMDSGDITELTKLTENTILHKYAFKEMVEEIDVEHWYRIRRCFKEYIEIRVKGNNLQRYIYFVGNFKTIFKELKNQTDITKRSKSGGRNESK